MTRVKDVHEPSFACWGDSRAIHWFKKQKDTRGHSDSELSFDTVSLDYVAEGVFPVDSWGRGCRYRLGIIK